MDTFAAGGSETPAPSHRAYPRDPPPVQLHELPSEVPPLAAIPRPLQVDEGLPSGCKVLIFDLFAGIDGLGWALDSHILGHHKDSVSCLFEVDAPCRETLVSHRVSPHTWLSPLVDSKGLLGSVFALTDNDFLLLRKFLQLNPDLQHISVVGGSPCVGFSAANVRRRGIDDPASNAMWVLPVLANRLWTFTRDRSAPPSVGFILENVAMLKSQEAGVSKAMGVQPLLLDAGKLGPVTRARNFWTNYEVGPLSGHKITLEETLTPGWAPLRSLLKTPSSDERFRTLLRPFPPGQPFEFKAEFWRLPLSTYDERGLVYLKSASASQLREIERWIHGAMRINTTELKTPGSTAVLRRGELATWIHTQGGSRLVRPLLADERDVAMGFPRGASGPRDSGRSDEWARMAATGNAFSVPVMAVVAAQLAQACQGHAPRLRSGVPSMTSASEALVALGASSSAPLNRDR